MIDLLVKSPLFLLFIVLGIGAPLGKIKILGVNLGIATILFTGLAFGSLSPDVKLPAIVYEIGLVIFIYAIGISSGEYFLANLKKRGGWRENGLAFATILFAFLIMLGINELASVRPSYLVGIFSGSLTNTPALAASLEFIKGLAPDKLSESILADPVVAYSVTYPMGIIGMILAIILFQKIFKTSLSSTEKSEAEKLTNATVEVTNKEVFDKTIFDVKKVYKLEVVFGRIKTNGSSSLALDETSLGENNLMTIVGKPEQVERAINVIGKRSDIHLEMDHQNLEMRRVFVSNHEIVGQSLKDLRLPHTMGILITRIRRGDTDILPDANTTLQFGDRVRILTGRKEITKASKFFGDSYSAQSEIDILTLGLGVAIGCLLGMVPIPLPGGITLKLGIAGGPLIVALLLGAVNRMGKIIFVMPYSANQTVRQLGLVLFLAGVGTRSGFAFRETLTQTDQGIIFFIMGIFTTISVAFFFLWIGYRVLRIPFPKLAGMLSGLQTQPALLAFVNEQSKSEQPNIGYASVFPIATLTKIIFAQILLSLLM